MNPINSDWFRLRHQVAWPLGIFVTALVICSHLALADEPSTQSAIPSESARAALPTPARTIRLDVKRVLIPVTVTDGMDRPVPDIQRQQFRIYEDGIEQPVCDVSSEEGPISIGIVLDTSGSMGTKLNQSLEAIREFTRLSLPNDEFSLTEFNERPSSVLGFTADPRRNETAVAAARADGATALFDALYLAMHQMKAASYARKLLFVLSDGGDNCSRYTRREVRSLLREGDVRVFALSILHRSRVLEEIADESGGRAYRVRNIKELPELAGRLSAEAHTQYVLSYTPANPRSDGKYRRVRVELIRPAGAPPLRTSWRQGYYDTAQ